jgi:coenzyme F420-reducing hydrogenase gamma subunit
MIGGHGTLERVALGSCAANRNFQRYEEAREKAEESFLANLKRFQPLAQSASKLQNSNVLPAEARICYVHSEFAI